MKKSIFLVTVSLIAISAVSCQLFPEGPTPVTGDSFTLKVSCAEDDTRTDLSGQKTVWNANDGIWLSDGNKETVVFVPAAYSGSTTADIVVNGLSKDSVIFATYPVTDESAIYNGNLVTDIPTVQDGSFASAHVAVGRLEPGQRELSFKNVTSIIRFSHNKEDIKDVQIRNINRSFSGSFSVNPLSGEKEKDVTAGRSIRIKMSGIYDKFIGVMPGEMEENSKLVFVTVDGKLGSIATSVSNSFKRNTIYDMGNIDDKITYYGEAVDLGQYETANCYIVPGPGVYKFKAVKGNTVETVSDAGYAEIVWESVNTTTAPKIMSLVSEIAYSGGYIYFRIPDDAGDGNSLVALYDENGEIAWSWHLWVLKGGVNDFTIDDGTGAYSGATLMDRNLGALTAIKGKSSSNGYTYQWGRKDPFTGSASIKANTMMSAKGINTPTILNETDESGTVEFSITHPYKFIARASKDWLTSSDATLWSATTKTVFDPCPPGYHVPSANILKGVKGTWDATNKGCSIVLNGKELWLPAGGNRKRTGLLENAGSQGLYWIDKNTRTEDSRNAWCVSSSICGVDTTTTRDLTCGFQIRCQKTTTVGAKQTVIIGFTTFDANKYVYSPIISSTGYSDAKVIWTSNFSENLENAKWKQYIYETPGDYSLTVTGYSIDNIKFKTLDGIKSIDISNF